MPKKPPKNGFYFFMLDFKNQQEKKGIQYDNLAEVARAADPEWRNAPNHVRTKFEDIAKHEKQKHRIPGMKYTSTGIPLCVIEQQNREAIEAAEFEKQDIRDMIKLKAFNVNHILDEFFFVIDVNAYCKTDVEYIFGESTVLRFNLRDGFRDFYHERINPGTVPFGYAFDVKLGSEALGLETIDEDSEPSNYLKILANIIDYLKQHDPVGKTLPPLYTMPEKIGQVKNFLSQMCIKAGEDECIFRVYHLDTFFFTLINAIKTNKYEGFPKESLAKLQLKKDVFKYTPGLGCEHHEAIDKAVECTTSRVKRWAYTILDSCCPIVGVEVKAGLHLPLDYDIEAILKYKEQNRERAAPTVAGFGGASSSFDDSFRDYSNSSIVSEPTPRKEKRKYAPMRMPQADYSKEIRPAPDLTEDDFPSLSIGTGRGRGIGRNLNRL